MGRLSRNRADEERPHRRAAHRALPPRPRPALRDLIFRETTTIGLHWRIENKESLARDFQSVTTPWGPVRIKIARWPSGRSPTRRPNMRIAAASPEHSVPLKQVHQTAMSLYLAPIEAPTQQ
jgi:uncharacterized protein (DUF111 family)